MIPLSVIPPDPLLRLVHMQTLSNHPLHLHVEVKESNSFIQTERVLSFSDKNNLSQSREGDIADSIRRTRYDQVSSTGQDHAS